MVTVNLPPTAAKPDAPRPLKRMFEAVPARYDLLNRLLTLGYDERWRRRAARECLVGAPARVLDLCCGTGDLARWLAAFAPPATELYGLDYSRGMLELARRKAARCGLAPRITFTEGDAAALPYPDAHFDAVGIAFAFRNLTWRNVLKDAALAEVRRVLRPGGRFVIVETSQPANALLRLGFHAYLGVVVSPLGTLISGHGSAYRYLARSAQGFADWLEVCDMLLEADFSSVTPRPLLGGVAALHCAIK